MNNSVRFIYSLFCLILMANGGLWLFARDMEASWLNVPPVPSSGGAERMTLGDPQLAYRSYGIMLQNLGDMGGRTTSLLDYDYNKLVRWFFLTDELDSRSSFAPLLAAFVYGGTPNPDALDPLIDYLKHVGTGDGKHDWRWLAHAVFLARHRQNDMDKALSLANTLADLDRDDMPAWTRKIRVLLLNDMGKKEEAYNIFVSMLVSGAKDLHPNEVNYLHDYICNEILTAEEAAQDQLCGGGSENP